MVKESLPLLIALLLPLAGAAGLWPAGQGAEPVFLPTRVLPPAPVVLPPVVVVAPAMQGVWLNF